MATLPSNFLNDDDEENGQGQLGQNQPQTSSGGGGVLSGGGSGTGSQQTAKQPASTGFVNFQTYLDANRDQVDKTTNDLVGAVRDARNDTVGEIRKTETQAISGLRDTGQDTYGMTDNPLSRPWRSEAETKYNAVRDYEPNWDRAVQAWQGQGGVYEATQNLGTRQGQSKALRDYMGKPGYTTGEHALDSALISADDSKFDQLAKETRDMGDIVGDARGRFGAEKDKILELWSPERYEERPDVGMYGYNQDMVNAGMGKDTLDRQAIDALMGTESSLRQAIESGDLGPKAKKYLEEYLGQVAPVADEQDYRSDLATTNQFDNALSGFYEASRDGRPLTDSEMLELQNQYQGLNQFIGSGNANARVNDKLTRIEQRFAETLTNNAINQGLAQSGYSSPDVLSFNSNVQSGDVVDPASIAAMRGVYDALMRAAQNTPDSAAKRALADRANEILPGVQQAEKQNAFFEDYNRIHMVASQSGYPPPDEARVQQLLQNPGGATNFDEVSGVFTTRDAVANWMRQNPNANPYVRQRMGEYLKNLQTLGNYYQDQSFWNNPTGYNTDYLGGGYGSYPGDKPVIIPVEDEQMVPYSGGIGR